MGEAETELVCDFAEYYHVYDFQALPVTLAATLVSGLREDSRTKMKIHGRKQPIETMLLAAIADRLSLLVWFETKDGHANRNRPKFFTDEILERNQEPDEKPMAFNSKEELDAALAEFERKG